LEVVISTAIFEDVLQQNKPLFCNKKTKFNIMFANYYIVAL